MYDTREEKHRDICTKVKKRIQVWSNMNFYCLVDKPSDQGLGQAHTTAKPQLPLATR